MLTSVKGKATGWAICAKVAETVTAPAGIVKAYVPLSEMFGYATDLRSRTQGRGNYSMFFEKYEQVPKSVQEKILAKKD